MDWGTNSVLSLDFETWTLSELITEKESLIEEFLTLKSEL